MLALAGVVSTSIALIVFDARTSTRLTAVLVAMIYGVYAGFALSSGSARQLAIEGAFIVAGVVMAFLGLEHGWGWLAAALVLHGVWDLLHHADHQVLGTPGVPRWYVPFCATYDVLAAVVVIALL